MSTWSGDKLEAYNTGRVTAVTRQQQASMVWLLFELHYLFDNTSILELHSCIWCVNSGVNIFSLPIHIGSTQTVLCSASLCTSVHHSARVKCLIKIAILWILCVNFAPFCDCLCWNCFAVTYVSSCCFIWVHYAVIFIVLRSAEIVHFVTGNLPS